MLEQRENSIQGHLQKFKIFDKYYRFEIDSVEDVGPNDFRSVAEVRKATENYLSQNMDTVLQAAKQIEPRERWLAGVLGGRSQITRLASTEMDILTGRGEYSNHSEEHSRGALAG